MLNSYNFISFKQQWPVSSRVLLAYLLLPLQMSPDLQSKQPGWPLCTFKRKISARETVLACISSLTVPLSKRSTWVLKTDPSMDDNINEQLPAPGTTALLPDCMRQESRWCLLRQRETKTGFHAPGSIGHTQNQAGSIGCICKRRVCSCRIFSSLLPSYVKWNDKRGLGVVLLPAILNSLGKQGLN